MIPAGQRPARAALGQHTRCGEVDQVAKTSDNDVDQPVVDAVQQVAEERGVQIAQISIAWLLSKPVVSAPIIGATKPHHLADAVAAVGICLTDEEIARLEARSTTQSANPRTDGERRPDATTSSRNPDHPNTTTDRRQKATTNDEGDR
jgi:aryl-alcohol dehydrogenase-like predicted oxidoreductase